MEIYNLSELGGLYADCPAGPSVDSYNVLFSLPDNCI
jgi:hypothetical protein